MAKKVGLYFGSFNPVHIGHLIISNFMLENSDLDEIWFVLSPQSPFKKKSSLLDNHHRLELLNIAIDDYYPRLRVSDIEFKLPQPNYTIDTLVYLKERYSDIDFNIIMGEDNLNSFHRWKNYEKIIEDYKVYVYPRPKLKEKNNRELKNIVFVDAPIMEISSSMIREGIKKGKKMDFILPSDVYQYIIDMHFYE